MAAPPAGTTRFSPVAEIATPRRRLAVETESLVGGVVAGGSTVVVAMLSFFGSEWPLWGGWSVGALAAIAVIVSGVAVAATGYWRARDLPGQEWRHELGPWKFSLDVATVSAVHAVIAGLITVMVFVLLQRSFEGLVVDPWIGAGASGVASGLAAYWIYLSVSSITTPKLASLLVVFMSITVLTSMATSQDPQWWEIHFSQLGTVERLLERDVQHRTRRGRHVRDHLRDVRLPRPQHPRPPGSARATRGLHGSSRSSSW